MVLYYGEDIKVGGGQLCKHGVQQRVCGIFRCECSQFGEPTEIFPFVIEMKYIYSGSYVSILFSVWEHFFSYVSRRNKRKLLFIV